MMQTYDVVMTAVRTTISIDDELLVIAKQMAATQRRTVGSILEDALREQLARREASRAQRPRVTLPVSGDPTARLLVDIHDKEALAEALGDNEPRW